MLSHRFSGSQQCTTLYRPPCHCWVSYLHRAGPGCSSPSCACSRYLCLMSVWLLCWMNWPPLQGFCPYGEENRMAKVLFGTPEAGLHQLLHAPLGKSPLRQNRCLRILVRCWSFRSWQHLRSYQDGFRLVTVHTYGDFKVLGEIRLPANMTRYPTQAHYPDTKQASHCSMLLMLSARLQSD